MPAEDPDTVYNTRGNEDSDDVDDDDSSSVDTDFGKEPLILEAIPPYAPFSRDGPEGSLFNLHNQLRRGAVITISRAPKRAPEPSQTRSQSLAQGQAPPPQANWTSLFEETEYPGYIGSQSFCSSPPVNDLSDLTCSSGDGRPSSGSGMQSCTTSIRELVAIEVRNATAHCTALGRRLRRKLRR